MIITYGTLEKHIDVTQICFEKLLKNNIITIPHYEQNRIRFFGDPVVGSEKKVFIVNNDNSVYEFTDNYKIYINVLDNKMITFTVDAIKDKEVNTMKLQLLQKELIFNHGSIYDEMPEQLMAITYLTGKEKVLELGSNIGRNSLVIGTVLKDNNNPNFVTMESDRNFIPQLTENRDINGLSFHIENAALSKRKLVQHGWDTVVVENPEPGTELVNTITYKELKTKYNIDFDTLMAGCEGALYYILLDMPEILDNIQLIIVENDYKNIEHKNYIDNLLYSKNFYVDYSDPKGGEEKCCCYNNFYEVWKKI